jgi:hypothetical protein
MSYIYGAPCKVRNFNIVYILTYVWQCWKPSLSICCTMFQHWINAESYPVAQLCVNILPATKVTLITMGFNLVGWGLPSFVSCFAFCPNPDTWPQSMLNFTQRPLYTRGKNHQDASKMNLAGPQNQSGGFGEERTKLLLLSGFEPLDCPPLSLVTTLIELRQPHPKWCKPKIWILYY